MKTARPYLYKLHNEEHLQFGADVLMLVKRSGIEEIVMEQSAEFAAVHKQEDDLLEMIRRSALTAQIEEADVACDELYYGLAEQVRLMRRHFNPEVKDAAGRVQIVFDTYGSVATLSYAEQTGKTYNLARELADNHIEDCTALGIVPWLQELDKRNRVVEELLRSRDSELTVRTMLVMKEVRTRADAAYRALVGAVESLAVVAAMGVGGDAVGPAAQYEGFLASLDALIERYNMLLAVRRGFAAAKKEREEAAVGGGTNPSLVPEPALVAVGI